MDRLFKNKTWTERRYDVTNVVYQVVPAGKNPIDWGTGAESDNWVEVEIDADERELHELMGTSIVPTGFSNIGRIEGRTFWGHL